MADPSGTARGTPAGTPIGDGFATKITLASDTTIEFWEKSVTPPGVDGGDPVETTTMYNTTWRTMRARQLKTLTEVSAVVAYDAAVYPEIVRQINNETTITVEFPNDDYIAFYGYLRSFTPSEIVEGSQPEAAIVIQPTNWDSGSGQETGTNIVFGTGL